MRKMDFDFSKMTACDKPFYSVVTGKAAYPTGRVCLPVTFGTKENFHAEYLTFEVANFRSSYHAFLGRPMLAKFMAIPHHTYLIMKMPSPNGILSVLATSSSPTTARATLSTSPRSLCAKLPPRLWSLRPPRSTKLL
jgi:hypothetical protein